MYCMYINVFTKFITFATLITSMSTYYTIFMLNVSIASMCKLTQQSVFFFLFQRPGQIDADHGPGVDVEQGAARAGLTSTYWLGEGRACTDTSCQWQICLGPYRDMHIRAFYTLSFSTQFTYIQAYTYIYMYILTYTCRYIHILAYTGTDPGPGRGAGGGPGGVLHWHPLPIASESVLAGLPSLSWRLRPGLSLALADSGSGGVTAGRLDSVKRRHGPGPAWASDAARAGAVESAWKSRTVEADPQSLRRISGWQLIVANLNLEETKLQPAIMIQTSSWIHSRVVQSGPGRTAACSIQPLSKLHWSVLSAKRAGRRSGKK